MGFGHHPVGRLDAGAYRLRMRSKIEAKVYEARLRTTYGPVPQPGAVR